MCNVFLSSRRSLCALHHTKSLSMQPKPGVKHVLSNAAACRCIGIILTLKIIHDNSPGLD